jgi:mRNA interferase RelE/StbE
VTHGIEFHPAAFKEWNRLDRAIKRRLGMKLAVRVENPRNAKDALSGALAGCFKIKDSVSGYRLVYEVVDDVMVIMVLSVGQRENLKAYVAAALRRK